MITKRIIYGGKDKDKSEYDTNCLNPTTVCCNSTNRSIVKLMMMMIMMMSIHLSNPTTAYGNLKTGKTLAEMNDRSARTESVAPRTQSALSSSLVSHQEDTNKNRSC